MKAKEWARAGCNVVIVSADEGRGGDDDDDNDCRLVEHSVSMYKSCSRRSNVVKETQQKERIPAEIAN